MVMMNRDARVFVSFFGDGTSSRWTWSSSLHSCTGVNTKIALYYERARGMVNNNTWAKDTSLQSYGVRFRGIWTLIYYRYTHRAYTSIFKIVTYVISIVFHSRSNSSAFSDGFGLRSIAGVADSWPLHVRLLRMARGDSRFSADGNCSKSTSNLSAFQNTFNSVTCCIDFHLQYHAHTWWCARLGSECVWALLGNKSGGWFTIHHWKGIELGKQRQLNNKKSNIHSITPCFLLH